MKTAISLPDRVFREAERFARRVRKTRSRLYAEALAEYLARHAPDDITESINQVCDRIGVAPRHVQFQGCPRSPCTGIMVAIARGEIWWADLSEPVGSQPGFRRPVVVVQGDPFNRSRIATVVVVPLTSNLQWADAPGNVLLTAEVTRLSKDSVANVSQIITVDRGMLTERISKLPQNKLDLLYAGIDIVLDR